MTSLGYRLKFLFFIVIFAVAIYAVHRYTGTSSMFGGSGILVHGNRYKVVDMKGDGNCMMRALADQYNQSHNNKVHHLDIRRTLTRIMERDKNTYNPDARTVSVSEMKKSGTYGGHMELVAAANHFKRDIMVYDNENKNVLVIEPTKKKHETPWVLYFTPGSGDEGHYGSTIKN